VSSIPQPGDKLEQDLRSRIKGEVRFDNGSRALYATDASNYRMVPIGVVLPRDIDDVLAAIEIARKHDAPILARGGGTSLAGQCCNTAVVLDFSKYMRGIVEVNATEGYARVQPGVVLDRLREAAEEHHLTFGPDPATHRWCTLGGMIGNNSCGVHSIMSGRTSDNIESLDILTYDGLRMTVGPTSDEELQDIIAAGGRIGEIYRNLRDLRDRYANLIRNGFPKLPRRVSGYNLDELLPENGFNVARALVGTEGTCVTILEAKTRLIHSPRVRVLVAIGWPDIYVACDRIPEIMSFEPIGLEGMDEHFMHDLKRKQLVPKDVALFPDGNAWLLVEFGGETLQEATDKAERLIDRVKSLDIPPNSKLFTDPLEQRRIWRVREAGLPATASTGTDKENHEGWEDAAVPPERLGAYLRAFRDLLKKYDYESALYGHFGHGCVHTRLTFDLKSADGIAIWRKFLEEAAALVVSFGGSLSGEHGDGQSRAELLPIMFGSELVQAFREFKGIWDPTNKMNPGKVVNPYRVDENLRYGADYRPLEPLTVFQFPDDVGSFTKATERCVGAGLCRKTDGGTMCPSYMATLEEQYSTRGRARLLFEMLQGDPLTEAWKSEEVKEALDLCLACKACKDECPVKVDMATYKSEFLSHYYEGKFRPRAAYSMGLINQWSKIGSAIPGITNFLSQNPVTAPILKLLGGIAPKREIPKFAKKTFKSWFFNRPNGTRHPEPGIRVPGPRVILWADTFSNNFHPQIAQAAVEVLESVGYQVVVPNEAVCCGRPLYDWGMLEKAKLLLEETMRVLEPLLKEDIRIVVLEPSCASVFRDELINLYPKDPRAQKIASHTLLFSEFVAKYVDPLLLPKIQSQVLVHGHCHQKALMKMDSVEQVLKSTGANYTILDTGCCGMAGAFGFEKSHYDVSQQVGELSLLPQVRNADPDAIIVTDGFSCREQIRQATGREAVHLAELLRPQTKT
jgi:FAD/FMN-containing dehydrogenase/Fe-S oxidoreductase